MKTIKELGKQLIEYNALIRKNECETFQNKNKYLTIK